MKKLINVLKATMSGDMSIFKLKVNKSARISNKLLIIFLMIILLSVGFTYSFMIAGLLKTVNMTYVMLEIFAVAISVLALFECIYKSQGILFDAKDNGLLFSMPIKKKTIMSARLIKLITFEYIFDLLFFSPAIIVYAILEKTSWQYWLTSIIMFLLLPIIPTVLGSAIGYIIKAISSKFKKGKVFQTIVTLAFTLGVAYLSCNLQGVLTNMTNNANTVGTVLSNIYYPIKLYTKLIIDFNIKDLAILILLNIIISSLFVKIFSISYFKVISKSSEISKNAKYKLKTKSNSQLKALLIKDIKRFFSSPVYIVNAGFGLVLLMLLTVLLCVNFEGTVNAVVKNLLRVDLEINIQDVIKMMPMVFLGMIAFIIPMTMINSAAISIEGKSLEFVKTLPISPKKILFSKVLMSDIIIIIPSIICAIAMSIKFKFAIIYVIQIISVCIILANFISMIGLIINLIVPKMDAKNDTEAVKQSISVIISTFLGMCIFGALITIGIMLNSLMSFNNSIYVELAILAILNLVSWSILVTYGEKRLYKI